MLVHAIFHSRRSNLLFSPFPFSICWFLISLVSSLSFFFVVVHLAYLKWLRRRCERMIKKTTHNRCCACALRRSHHLQFTRFVVIRCQIQMKKICGFSFVCCCYCRRRRRRRWQFIVYIFVLSSLPICALHAQWVWWCVVSAVHFSVTRCHCCWFCVFFHLLRWWWSDTDWERRRKPNNKSNWIEYISWM